MNILQAEFYIFIQFKHRLQLNTWLFFVRSTSLEKGKEETKPHTT